MTDTIVGRCADCDAPNYGSRFCESCGARYIPPIILPQPIASSAVAGGYANEHTNTFAVVSLVLGLLGGTLIAIIFGHIALGQIKRTGERGRGMALAGTILGYFWFAAVLVILIVYIVIVSTALQPDYGY